jgi:malonyl-CoA decarboxylase
MAQGEPASHRRLFERVLSVRNRAPADESLRVALTCEALLSETSEVSGLRLATEILHAYGTLDDAARDTFFDLLLTRFSPDRNAIASAVAAYSRDPGPAQLVDLRAAVESPRQELFRRLNMAPGGTRALVAMRRQLLRTIGDHPQRLAIDADLSHLFRSWFNRGFLVLQRIDWRTSALVLERLIRYEAVHQIQGWHDLRRRLEADRRCYAFFHPALPDEPLIFIEVALTADMPERVWPLLDPDSEVVDPSHARCAVFYSITNCQDGLRGVSFGNFLIKQVVQDLGNEFPRVRTFATLSPVPEFRKWLEHVINAGTEQRPSAQFAALLATTDVSALADDGITPELRNEITRLCAWYLLCAKENGEPLDPVARFHLANGASLERLNWMGDPSPQGMRRSLGIMVNYVYRIADVERHHEAYAREHRVIASHQFERLAKRSSGTVKFRISED